MIIDIPIMVVIVAAAYACVPLAFVLMPVVASLLAAVIGYPVLIMLRLCGVRFSGDAV